MGVAVCKRGHVAGGDAVPVRFCAECAAPILKACEQCRAEISRVHLDPGTNAPRYMWPTTLPDFCPICSQTFPWASREKRIGKLYNLLDFETDLDEATKLEVIEQIAVLSVSDNDAEESGTRQAAAVERMRSLAPHLVEVGKAVIIEVLSEAARKRLQL